jgi:hypothetical protein
MARAKAVVLKIHSYGADLGPQGEAFAQGINNVLRKAGYRVEYEVSPKGVHALHAYSPTYHTRRSNPVTVAQRQLSALLDQGMDPGSVQVQEALRQLAEARTAAHAAAK